jgi:putative RecB family exonuclease
VAPLSVSQVSCYLACPLQYRFRYVDRLPRPWTTAALAFGTSIHAAVEHVHRATLAGGTPDVAEALAVFEADWHAANLEPLIFTGSESPATLAEKGRALLRLYLAAQQHPTTAVEDAFECDLTDPVDGEVLDVRLRGRIDRIEQGPVIVELKTAARTLEPGGLERHLQLSVYALVFLLRYGTIPGLRLDLLLKTKVPRFLQLPTFRTLEDLAWTARLLERVARAIAAGHFFPNPSWRCSECEYFGPCAAWRGEEQLAV